MKINYCLPIIKNSKQDVLRTIEKYRNEYQYVEVWLDPIKNLDNDFIDRLTYMLQDKLILLFSRGNELQTSITKEKKLKILDLLDDCESFLDLDLSDKEELAYLKRKKLKVKIIISYHNYQETPPEDVLKGTLNKMAKYNPTIYKIATLCMSENDTLRLLQLQLSLRKQKTRHIVLGMGEFGKITRVFGTVWGNEMIYAPITKQDVSAPGQLTKQELEKIFSMLRTN